VVTTSNLFGAAWRATVVNNTSRTEQTNLIFMLEFKTALILVKMMESLGRHAGLKVHYPP
jgi:hypothetical protein